MTAINHKRLSNVLWAGFFIVIIYVLAVTLGCTSKSGQLDKLPLERVVIVDGLTETYERDVTTTLYKVNRIEHGVVTYINIQGSALYAIGDTIFWRFF